MKIRSDFVTNSSSSSFIAIRNKDYSSNCQHYKDVLKNIGNELALLSEGHTEFGWSPEVFSDFYSKFNYILIQVASHPDPYLITAVNDLIEDDLNIKINWIDIFRAIKEGTAYIDHQTQINEDGDIEKLMFDIYDDKSFERLRQFLYNDESCIITGNDNSVTLFDDLDVPYRYNNDYTIC